MKKKILIITSIIATVVILIVAGIVFYILQTNPVNRNNTEDKIIEIEEKTRTEEIVDILKSNNLIRNSFITKVYIKLNGIKALQAGKYQLNESMSLGEILNKISSGEVYDETIKITFNEGKNIRWIAKTIAEKTDNAEEDVYSLLQDKEYINSLIEKYWFLTDTITDENIYYPLEGYLYPDTYIFENRNVSIKTIFSIMLNQTDKILTKYRTQIESSGRSIHEILTIASIIELEGSYEEARKGISSVIYNRLKLNMSLGSDVTTYYAVKVDMGERNLYKEEINTYNPYNTRGPNMSGKIPVGPIANPSEEAIYMALNPANTNYLYFVADSNGKIYFTNTYEEHQQLIANLQKQGLWYEYDK